jgi:DnaJ-domain-containing protein 1
VTEILIREQIELERRRDRENRIDRINGVEKALAVLQTRFEAALERAVSGDDLKELKREVEDQMKTTFNSITASIKSANDQQARDILGQVELMNARAHEMSSRESQNLRRQIFLMMLGTAFSVIGSIAFLVLTGRG